MIRCAHFTCHACRPTEPERDAEIEALRAVAKKAHELARWDWLPLLVDDPNAADVRDGVAQLRSALAKVPR